MTNEPISMEGWSMDRSLNRDDYPKLNRWLTAIEGVATPQTVQGTDVQCDLCESIIGPGEQLTNYLCNELVNEDVAGDDNSQRPFYFLRAYCSDCDRQEILHPCQGYVELLLGSELDPNRRLCNHNLLDFSGRTDGVAYTPENLWDALHRGTTWDSFQQALEEHRGHPVRLGPADITDDLLYHDVEPTEVYSPDGEIRLTEEELRELAKRFDK